MTAAADSTPPLASLVASIAQRDVAGFTSTVFPPDLREQENAGQWPAELLELWRNTSELFLDFGGYGWGFHFLPCTEVRSQTLQWIADRDAEDVVDGDMVIALHLGSPHPLVLTATGQVLVPDCLSREWWGRLGESLADALRSLLENPGELPLDDPRRDEPQ